MKIAFLNRYQFKVERGAEIFVSELTKKLSKNHQVDILAGEDADSLEKVLKGNYDVVVPINGRVQSLKFSLLRRLGGYKLLITGHSGKGWDDIINTALAKPDVFVALTNYQLEWAKKWAWGSKLIKIPNGIDLEKFRPEGEKIKIDLERPIILSVGALVWYKYHDRVIRAVKQLSYGSALIVGEGPDEEKLLRLGKKLLGNRFKIAKFSYQDMPKVYRSTDLFTLPSWDREAFGIVYLEAMASGLAVVAPDDSIRREIIGEAGIFVDVTDFKKYARTIKDSLNKNWDNLPKLQAQKFSWEKIAKEYGKMMQEIIKND